MQYLQLNTGDSLELLVQILRNEQACMLIHIKANTFVWYGHMTPGYTTSQVGATIA